MFNTKNPADCPEYFGQRRSDPCHHALSGRWQQRLMGIVHQNGVRIGRTLEEKEVDAENSKCNADFGIMQEAEGWIRKRY